MATPSDARLVLLPFLQTWDGSNLHIRVVVLPKIPPRMSLVGASGPSFATASFTLEAHFLPADNLPTAGGTVLGPFPTGTPPNANSIFENLETELRPTDSSTSRARRPANSQVNKYLPVSYREAVGYSSSNPLLKTGNEYHCSMAQRLPATEKPPKIKLPDRISWGRIIAQLLKNPVLGTATGIIREISIPIQDNALVENGGFVYLAMSPSSDGAGLLQNPTDLKVYATQFPSLLPAESRALFSPCLFPLVGQTTSIDYSTIFSEVQDYNDGFAKAVHCSQQRTMDPIEDSSIGTGDIIRPVKETGIRLGWDDEQVTVWLNRQWDASQPEYDAPLGTSGYRVDARMKGTTEWKSLMFASGNVKIGSVDLDLQTTELSISINPAQLDAKFEGTYWVPMYYDSWTGPSMGSKDDLQQIVLGLPPSKNMFRGDTPDISLRYGKTYEFRVRLMDTAAGGPSVSSEAAIAGPAGITSIAFKRYIVPGLPIITRGSNKGLPPDPSNPPTELGFKRPLLAYPAIACTAETNVRPRLEDDIRDIRANALERPPGLPDPDVDRVQIDIQVYTFPQDPDADSTGYRTVYTTHRLFPSNPATELVVRLRWIDINNVDDLPPDSGADALVLPTGRQVRLQVYSLCKDDNGPIKYFGGQDVRLSHAVFLSLRKHSTDEQRLYADLLPSEQFSAYFLKADPPVIQAGSVDTLERLAAALDLPLQGNTIRAQPGERVVFGCAPSLAHQVGPDGASLTLSTKAALSNRWIVIIRIMVRRDWSWDAFAHDAFQIERGGQTIGRIAKSNALSSEAVIRGDDAARRSARAQTTFVFIDSIDPQSSSGLPQELNPRYQVTPSFQGNPTKDAPLELTIRLPVTTAPTQVPKIVSAGLAMSPYVRDTTDYSSSDVRQKRLWLEFEETLADSRDAYFARVLRDAPDLMIFPTIDTPVLEPLPALPVDPEEMRHIVRGQAADYAGLGAMTQLIPADSDTPGGPVRHFLLPLPCDQESPRLFGLWTYEIRVGHARPADPTESFWSTAQGRFGPPLIVNGLQHPPPPLRCYAYRLKTGISASAPYASTVSNGTRVGLIRRPGFTSSSRGFDRSSITTMWFLVYAQAKQLDGADRRNILIERKRDDGIEHGDEPPRESERIVQTSQAHVLFDEGSLQIKLRAYGFKPSAPLSVMAVEMSPNFSTGLGFPDPLGGDLGQQRILRTSPLTPVQTLCGR